MIATLLTVSGEAKTFRNSYISFELNDRWNCGLEQTEWVCRTQMGSQDPREAIIILTAKEVGPSDSVQAYQAHLKTPRTLASRTGRPIQSQVIKVESRQINQHVWIDGMQLASEVPNYYSRYLATTKDKIAVLVTFSAHKSHYSKYSSDFFRSIESLRVVATKGLMGQGLAGAGGAPGADFLGSDSGGGPGAFSDDLPEEDSGRKSSGLNQKTQLVLFVALILGLIGLYLILKKPKTRKK